MKNVNLLVEEWGLSKEHAKFQSEVKTVLLELSPEAQLRLRNESTLQVEVIQDGRDAWAYFPIYESQVSGLRPVSEAELHRMVTIAQSPGENWEEVLTLNRRLILAGTVPAGLLDQVNSWAASVRRAVTVKPTTRILLTLGSQMFNGRFREKPGSGSAGLRDHLGHTLLYLRDPGAQNECVDAEREWKNCCR